MEERARQARALAKAFCDTKGGILAGRFLLPEGDDRRLYVCRRVAVIANSCVLVGEWAAASHMRALFSELGSQFARAAKAQEGVDELDSLRSDEVMRLHFQVQDVAGHMLVRHLPFMILTQAFFGLGFDLFSASGQAKIAVAFALSARSALGAALRTMALACCGSCYLVLVPCGISGAILVFVVVVAAKFVMSFICSFHVYSLSTRSCMDSGSLAAMLHTTESSVLGSKNLRFNDTSAVMQGQLAGLNRTLPSLLAPLQDLFARLLVLPASSFGATSVTTRRLSARRRALRERRPRSGEAGGRPAAAAPTSTSAAPGAPRALASAGAAEPSGDADA